MQGSWDHELGHLLHHETALNGRHEKVPCDHGRRQEYIPATAPSSWVMAVQDTLDRAQPGRQAVRWERTIPAGLQHVAMCTLLLITFCSMHEGDTM